MRETAEQLEAGDLGRTKQTRAEGYHEALAWVLSGGGGPEAESLTTEELLLAIYNELQELNSKTPGLPTGPETR
jgi:hypothetical protein